MSLVTESFVADGIQKTFTVSNDILSTSHCRVHFNYDDTVDEIDNPTDHLIDGEAWDLLGKSTIVFVDAPTNGYTVKITTSSDGTGLEDSPSSVGQVSANIDDIILLADNIDLLRNSLDGEYIVNGLPTTGAEGDLAVNVIDGGIYEWQTSEWVLIAQSASSSSSSGSETANAIIPSVDQLPESAEAGQVFHNRVDGFYYVYLSGEFEILNMPLPDIVGIEIVDTVVGLVRDAGTVVFNSSTDQLMKTTDGTTWIQVIEPTGAAATVADGTLTTAAFAAGLSMVEIFGVLPTVDNYIGRVVLLTVDSLLYRYTAAGWTSAVPTTSLVGVITETQIDDNAITTAKIDANAINANHIGAGEIKAGALDVGAVLAGTIEAGAIGATEIATDAIKATHVAANAIYSENIFAGEIKAVNIATDAIQATHIDTNTINAGHIIAGEIETQHIDTNAIRSNHILAGEIKADHLDSYSVTAVKIQSVPLDKIDEGTASITGGSFAFGEGVTLEGNGAIGSFRGTTDQKLALITESTNGWFGFAGVSYGSTSVGGVFTNSSNTSHTSFNTVAQFGSESHSIVTIGDALISGVVTASSFMSFTGAHYAIVDNSETVNLGDVVSVVDVYSIGISDTYSRVTKSGSYDKNVFGVISEVFTDTREKADSLFKTLNIDLSTGISPEYKELYDLIVDGSYTIVQCNALGEGMVTVNNSNGNIDSGDYLTTSIGGVGCKQDDDVLHNYTVGKALESVDWSTETSTTKMIACTYHCS